MNSFLRKLITPVAVFAASLGVALAMTGQREVVGAEAALTYVTENFEAQKALNASYTTGSFDGADGITLSFANSRDEGDYEINSKGIMLRYANSYLEFTLQPGLAGLKFQYRKAFTGKEVRQLEVLINGLQVTTTPTFGALSGAETTIYDLIYEPAVSHSGPSTVKIKNVGSGTKNKQTVIDNLQWSYTASADAVTALSVNPTSKTYFTTDKLLASDFAVTITKNGAAGTSSDYTAKIGTGTGATFTGTDIVWGTTQPTTADTTIQFKSKYPDVAGGSTYLTADVSLTVNTPLLESISVTTQPTKKTYNTNDEFDPTGMVVTASYNNGTSQPISNSSLSFSPSPLTQGTMTVTISYTEGSVTKTATISGLTVLTKTLNSISINTATSKLSFTLGETFVYPGLVIDAHYNGGTEEITSGFSVNGVDTMILGPQTATITFEEMTTSYAINVTNEGASVGPASTTNDLFISEWVEPSAGNNKFIEIYNPLDVAVDLSEYAIHAYGNGATEPTATLELEGTLAAGEVLVVYNSGQYIITEIPTTGWVSQSYPGVTDFNGDDAFALVKGENLLDVVGIIGERPSSGSWTGLDFLGASVQTKDSNWTRHGSITVPNATFTMAEWVVGPWDTHTLGSHTHAYNDVTVSQQATAFANYVMTGIGSEGFGQCETVLTALQTEYDFMVEDAQLEFETNSDVLFVNARARMAYLAAWVAPNSRGGTANPLDLASNTSITLLIGILGLTSVVGFYLVSKKKYEN